jgi:hypothetical protein
MWAVMRHVSVISVFVGVVVALGAQLALACDPIFPLRTLQQEYAAADRVYIARLVAFKRSPLPGDPDMHDKALEEATFEIQRVLKGGSPQTGKFATRTEYNGANCTLSIAQPALAKPSDVWILFLHGREPFTLFGLGHTAPMSLFSKTDLHFLLEESQKR